MTNQTPFTGAAKGGQVVLLALAVVACAGRYGSEGAPASTSTGVAYCGSPPTPRTSSFASIRRLAAFRAFQLPIRDAVPYVVRVDHSTGVVWIGTSAADAVLSFEPRASRFTVYEPPTRGALVRHLAIDPRTRDVWVAYGASPGIAARVARRRPR